MEIRKIKKGNMILLVLGALILLVALLDSIISKTLNESGFIMGIIIMGISFTTTPAKQLPKFSEKTEKILVYSTIILIASGIITFFAVV